MTRDYGGKAAAAASNAVLSEQCYVQRWTGGLGKVLATPVVRVEVKIVLIVACR